MTREERENALHCLKVMIDEEVCEECNLYGTTGTDHCEADCVRVAIKALQEHQHYKDLAESYEKTINKLTKAIAEQQPNEDCISRKAVLEGLASIAKAKAKSDIQKSLMGRVMFFTEHLPSVTPQPYRVESEEQ